jgi:hypothetical protein
MDNQVEAMPECKTPSDYRCEFKSKEYRIRSTSIQFVFSNEPLMNMVVLLIH